MWKERPRHQRENKKRNKKRKRKGTRKEWKETHFDINAHKDFANKPLNHL